MPCEIVGPQSPVLLEDSPESPLAEMPTSPQASDEEEEEMALGRSAASFINDALGFAVLALADEADESGVPEDASTGLCVLADGASEAAETNCSITEHGEELASPWAACSEKQPHVPCLPSKPTLAKNSDFLDLVCDLLDGALNGYAEQFGPLDPHLVEGQAVEVDCDLVPVPEEVLCAQRDAATTRPRTSRTSRHKQRPQALCESLWEQSATSPEVLEMLPPTPKLQEPQASPRPRMHAAKHSLHAILLEPPMLDSRPVSHLLHEDAPCCGFNADCTPGQLWSPDTLDGPLATYTAVMARPRTRRKSRPPPLIMELCEEPADIVLQPPDVPRASTSLRKCRLRKPQLDMRLVDTPADVVIEPPPPPTGGHLGNRGGTGGLLQADFGVQFCDSMPSTPAEASRPPLAPRNKPKANSKSIMQRTEVEEPEPRQQKKQGSRTARRSSSRRIDAGQTVVGGGRAAATSLSPKRHSSRGYASSSSSSHGPMTETPQPANSRHSQRLHRTESAADNLCTNSGLVHTETKGLLTVRISSSSPSPGARSKQGSRDSSLVNKFRALSASEIHCVDAMEEDLVSQDCQAKATRSSSGSRRHCSSSSSSHNACRHIDGDDGNNISAIAQDLGCGNKPAQIAAGLTPRRSSSLQQKSGGALAAPPHLPTGMNAVQLKKAPVVLPAIRPTGAFKVSSVGSISWRLDMERAAIGSWEPRPQAGLF